MVYLLFSVQLPRISDFARPSENNNVLSISTSEDEHLAETFSSMSLESSANINNDTCSTVSSMDDVIKTVKQEEFKIVCEKRIELLLELAETKHLFGIPRECIELLDSLVRHTGISRNHILLTLEKIRVNHLFSSLALEFGVSNSEASRIFASTLPLLAHHLRKFIYWPSRESILRNLPMAFRENYSDVESIIDRFEIKMEKSKEPVEQSDWSEYKKSNTLKYLISCTPDGMINFVSEGFSGRVSDQVLFQDCKFFDESPRKCEIMADRGFKFVDRMVMDR